MQAERKFLHDRVVPFLAEQVKKHGCQFELADSYPAAGDPEGEDGLGDALQAIDRCRPFFLLLLGLKQAKPRRIF